MTTAFRETEADRKTRQQLDFMAEMDLCAAMIEAKRIGSPAAKKWLEQYTHHEKDLEAYIRQHKQPKQPKPTIKIAKDSCSINSTLKARLIDVAKSYCNSGILSIGYVSHDNERRYSSFTPDNGNLPVLLICSSKDSIVDIGSMYPADAGHTAVRTLKAEIIRQHNAGEKRYW